MRGSELLDKLELVEPALIQEADHYLKEKEQKPRKFPLVSAILSALGLW